MWPTALKRHRGLRRSLVGWGAAAYTAASVGAAVLVSDAVHDLSQSSLDQEGLDPPIDAVVGVVAFLLSAAISAGLAVRCGRLRGTAIGKVAGQSLRAWERRFTLTAAAAVAGAIVTALID